MALALRFLAADAVESAGTGSWHVGDPPDARATAEAGARGTVMEGRARRFRPADFARFERDLAHRCPWLPPPLRARYARAYGSRVLRMLGSARQLDDLGEQVLPQLYAAEIDYLRREEWVQTAQDILWRRTKLGLHLPPDAAAQLEDWLQRTRIDDVGE